MAGIQGPDSANCISAVPVLNHAHKGMLNANVTIETPKDTQRAAEGRSPNAKDEEAADDGHPDQDLEQVVVQHHGRQISQSSSEARPRIIANA